MALLPLDAEGLRLLRRHALGETDDTAADIDRLLAEAAAQGLAGVAVTGTDRAIAAYGSAARMADAHGLFLVTCGQAVRGVSVTGVE